MAAQAAPLRNEVLDDFREPNAWKASASDQVQASLRRDADGSLCLDYDFAGVSGYAVMRRELPMNWPARFDLAVRSSPPVRSTTSSSSWSTPAATTSGG
jgi:hypothetical protein